jgi:hypothetical protein
MSGFSHCLECGRKLRDAVFCPQCGGGLCSRECLAKHAERHRAVPEAAPPAGQGIVFYPSPVP